MAQIHEDPQRLLAAPATIAMLTRTTEATRTMAMHIITTRIIMTLPTAMPMGTHTGKPRRSTTACGCAASLRA